MKSRLVIRGTTCVEQNPYSVIDALCRAFAIRSANNSYLKRPVVNTRHRERTRRSHGLQSRSFISHTHGIRQSANHHQPELEPGKSEEGSLLRGASGDWLIRRQTSLPLREAINNGSGIPAVDDKKRPRQDYNNSSLPGINRREFLYRVVEAQGQLNVRLEDTKPSAPAVRYLVGEEEAIQNSAADKRILKPLPRENRTATHVLSDVQTKERHTDALHKLAEAVIPMRQGLVKGEIEEYEGRYIGPGIARKQPHSKLLARRSNGLSRLAAEIEDFVRLVTPTPAELAARQAVVQEVEHDIGKDLPDWCSLELFGSQKTGLATTISDIDWRLSVAGTVSRSEFIGPKPKPLATRNDLIHYLTKLSRRLARMPTYKLALMRFKTFPLFNIQHEPSGLDLQIGTGRDPKASQEYMKRYMEEHPTLRTLFMFVRAMFKYRGLDDVFYGGFGSYAIFMMIVASLKLNNAFGPNDVARHLLAFLMFYAKIDTYNFGISVEPPELFEKKPAHAESGSLDDGASLEFNDEYKVERFGTIDPLQPYLLCLRDPARIDNDLGKGSQAIKHVQMTFKVLAELLTDELVNYSGQSLIQPLVGDIRKSSSERRAKVLQYGSQLAQS